MKRKMIVLLLIIMLFNMLYVQPVYAQTSTIESIKQKATELSLIKLAVGAGATSISTYSNAKGLIKDMTKSVPDVFDDFKNSVVDSSNKLKFAIVASDTVWQGVKSFFTSINAPINEPFTYIPSDAELKEIIKGFPLKIYSNVEIINDEYKPSYSVYLNDDILIKEGSSIPSVSKANSYYEFNIEKLSPLFNAINLGNSYIGSLNAIYFVQPLTNGYYTTGSTKFEYDSITNALTIDDNFSTVLTEPIEISQSYTLDGQIYDTNGTITLDPRSIDPDDDFVNQNTGDTPKRLVGFPLPWSELPSVSEGVINDGIDLGELSNTQLEAIDRTLDALLNQVGSLTTDLVRTEDLLKEALLNPPIDTSGVIPAIESLGNILTNAFNPATYSIDFTPLMNISILTDKFPFSIPWDLKNSISLLLDTPKAPIFEIPFNFWGLIDESVTLDFTIFDPVVGLFRWLITIAFTITLIYFSTVFI